jgi:hypothetical protein
MPNSGAKRPRRPIQVLVQNDDGTGSWDLGLMREWRWIDEAAGQWEGRIDTGAGRYHWVPGAQIRRAEGARPA